MSIQSFTSAALVAATFCVASSASAAVILRDNDIQTGPDPEGGASFNYNPGVNTVFSAYNTNNVTYTEGDFLTVDGPDEELQASTVGGTDGVLRYNVNSNGSDPFVADLQIDPIVQFDASLVTTTSSFVVINVDLNTNADPAGAPDPSTTLASFTPTATLQTFSLNLRDDPVFNLYYDAFVEGSGSFFQVRITQQVASGSGNSATVLYDDVQLVAIPEPTSAVAAVAGLGLLSMRRRRA